MQAGRQRPAFKSGRSQMRASNPAVAGRLSSSCLSLPSLPVAARSSKHRGPTRRKHGPRVVRAPSARQEPALRRHASSLSWHRRAKASPRVRAQQAAGSIYAYRLLPFVSSFTRRAHSNARTSALLRDSGDPHDSTLLLGLLHAPGFPGLLLLLLLLPPIPVGVWALRLLAQVDRDCPARQENRNHVSDKSGAILVRIGRLRGRLCGNFLARLLGGIGRRRHRRDREKSEKNRNPAHVDPQASSDEPTNHSIMQKHEPMEIAFIQISRRPHFSQDRAIMAQRFG